MRLPLLAGDGIGPEIAVATRTVLTVIDVRFGLDIQVIEQDISFAALNRCGSMLTAGVVQAAEAADGVILGPVDTAAYPSSEAINPLAAFRRIFDLYANIRHACARAGTTASEPGIDLLLVRENTEGFYADRTMFAGSGEFMPTPDLAMAVREDHARGCDANRPCNGPDCCRASAPQTRHCDQIERAQTLRTSCKIPAPRVR